MIKYSLAYNKGMAPTLKMERFLTGHLFNSGMFLLEDGPVLMVSPTTGVLGAEGKSLALQRLASSPTRKLSAFVAVLSTGLVLGIFFYVALIGGFHSFLCC